MRDQIIAMLPEVNEISDTDLRENSIKTWVAALDKGDLSLDNLKTMPFTLLVAGVKVTFIEHVRTVCRMCMATWDVLQEAYGERNKVKRDILIAGALLADVGKVLEFAYIDGKYVKSEHAQYLRHPFSGVGLAWEQKIPDSVMHVIAMHSKEAAGGKRTPEGIVFHHCDFIDFELVGG